MADTLRGRRVLVVANEQVAERMAGPAIRALNLARQLAARGAAVTLAMPGEPRGVDEQLAGLETAAFGTPSARGFRTLADAHDVVVTQPQRMDVAAALARSGARVVYDLYVPSFVERIAQLGVEPGDETFKARLLERDRREYAAAVATGDAFICASERQRDHWLGALGQAGRLDLHLLERDPRADKLIGVVPFGVEDPPAPLAAGSGPIRGALVPSDAVVLVWTGGLWNWFDPVTVVEGLARARERDARLHLVVMGMHHPESAWQEQDASRMMRERAGELGLLEPGGGVVLLDAWVPYAERHMWLQDADAAVSAHHDTLETRLSFRTRFLDQLWCGLPTITTAGGELTERMAASGAALEVADGDGAVDAWADALVTFAGDEALRARMSVAASELADAYRWETATEPLAALVASDARAGRRVSRGALMRYLALLVRVRIEAKGAGSLGAAVRGAAGR